MTFSLPKPAGMLLRSLPALSIAVLSLTACAGREAYPSLLPRTAETRTFDEPAAPPPAAVVADPALDARIATAERMLSERAAAFDAAAARAARQVTAAGRSPAGSEAWLDAQVALAELDTLRSSTQELVTDLEEVAAERATALTPDYPALDAAIERVRVAAAAQVARIAALQGALAPT
ncbi:hypothetical protein [Sphingomonas radiodurans]|uniref:hypothetical protein n=1 Tax=Sphingomonas radiodurans TaxID=2890321 RepID=UPI001E2CD5EB|nr:hypothetical protein [Sphingomonas radiodurans]WBH16227.1 hypothetical protein LLW23_15680 [Sphingomonas radiodurans]